MLYLHIAYTRIVVFMTCFYIVSVLNKPHIHHHYCSNINLNLFIPSLICSLLATEKATRT
jgi:glycopeptide antibiotics resistance protein